MKLLRKDTLFTKPSRRHDCLKAIVGMLAIGILPVSMAATFNRPALHGAYLGLGLGYSVNTAAGKNNILNTNQGVSFIQSNSTGAYATVPRIDVGYIWSFSPHWSWSLGGRLDHANFSQSGAAFSRFTSSLLPNGNYQYDIEATDLDVVARLIASTHRWQYYGEVMTGAALLNSNNYMVNAPGQAARIISASTTNLNYGVGLGILVRVAHHTSVGVSVDYVDLGTTKLKAYSTLSSVDLSGNITQRLQTVTTTLNIVQWF